MNISKSENFVLKKNLPSGRFSSLKGQELNIKC